MKLIPYFIQRRIKHRPNLVKIVDNIGWLFVDKILRMGVGLLVGVWIARYLGPEQFGILNFCLAFVGLFAAVPTLGLQNIIVRDITQRPEDTCATLGTAALLQVIAGSITYVAIIIAIVLIRPEEDITKNVVLVLGAILLFEASKIATFWFESQVQSKYTVWVHNSIFLIFAVIKILLIQQQAVLMEFVWVMLAEMIIASTITILVMNKIGPPLKSLKISIKRAKNMLQDCWPLAFSAIAISIYLKIDQVMLGQIAGNQAVGIYSVATKISEIWYFIPIAIASSVFPSILEAKKTNEAEYYARLQKLYNLISILSIALALPFTFIAEPMIVYLYGEAYRSSGIVLSIHIWASIPVFLGVASSYWFIAEGNQRALLYKALIGATSNIILNLILIPDFGPTGAATATLISYAIADLLYDSAIKQLQKQFKMKIKSLTFFWIFNDK